MMGCGSGCATFCGQDPWSLSLGRFFARVAVPQRILLAEAGPQTGRRWRFVDRGSVGKHDSEGYQYPSSPEVEAEQRLLVPLVMRGFVLIGLGLAVGASVAWIIFATRSGSAPPGEPPDGTAVTPVSRPSDAANPAAQAAGTRRTAVHALGTIEPAAGIVSVSSPLVGYRLDAIHVREGQLVTAGQLLFTLDTTHPQAELDLVQSQLDEAEQRQRAELRLAEQRLTAAEVAYEQAIQGGQLEREAQQSRLEAVAARKRQAERDLQRVEELRRVRESLVSEQQLEQQQVVVESAGAELRAAELSLRALEQSHEFRRTSAKLERESAQTAFDLARQGVGLEALRQRLELARIQLQQTEVRAPSDGVVLALSIRGGELVGQMPLLQLADLTSLVCHAEIDAADIPLVKPGQPVEVTIRGREEQPIPGTLERVSSVAVESRLHPLDPRTSVAPQVARGVVNLDLAGLGDWKPSGGELSLAAWVGLQVEVRFPLGDPVTDAAGGPP